MQRKLLVDSHCHLQQMGNVSGVLQECFGLHKAVCNSTSEEDWEEVLNLSKCFTEVVPCVGIHPWWGNQVSSDWETKLVQKLLENPHAQVGEIGLDHMKSKIPSKQAQEAIFRAQVRIALEHNRVMSIHCVKAFGKVVNILKQEMQLKKVPFLMHSYEGPLEMTQELLKHFSDQVVFSLSMVSVSKEKLRNSILSIPLENILIETDSPSQVVTSLLSEDSLKYYNSNPQNHPKFLHHVLSALAQLKGIDQLELEAILYNNFLRVFNL